MSYLKEHDDHMATDESVSYSMVGLVSHIGELDLYICDACGYVVVECAHTENTWNKKRTQLICNLCGADGT